ncbi:MAG TPA: hypothetical protein PLD48_03040 [Bacillota bacterium]|nr:hypothetical protein [Bacillota bacterium]
MQAAEIYIKKEGRLNPIELLVGNIAPDCGVLRPYLPKPSRFYKKRITEYNPK